MVFLITPSTVYKRFKIRLLVLSLVESVHHTSLWFLNLYRLPVNYRINFKICCITHHVPSVHESYYFSSLFGLRSTSHSLRSSFSPLLLSYFNKISHGFRSHSIPGSNICHKIKSVKRQQL